jgi:multidrug efflux pump subunit AcrA (membrane-fusion protein)
MRAPVRIFLLIGSFIVVMVVALFFFRSRRPEHQEAGPAQSPNVSTVPATRRSISRNLELAAVFQPFQEVDIHGKVFGYIRRINVDIGDRVRQGQVLATLEVPELQAQVQGADAGVARSRSDIDRLQNEVARAQAGFAATHASYQRLKSASDQQPGLIAAQELDDAQGRDGAAAAQVDAAKSAVATAQQQLGMSRADLQRVHTLAQYATITAPSREW